MSTDQIRFLGCLLFVENQNIFCDLVSRSVSDGHSDKLFGKRSYLCFAVRKRFFPNLRFFFIYVLFSVCETISTIKAKRNFVSHKTAIQDLDH